MNSITRLSLIAAASLTLSGCVTTANAGSYADSLYRIARVAGEEAVRHGKMSVERFDHLDSRAQAILTAIHAGSAGIGELRAVTDQMR